MEKINILVADDHSLMRQAVLFLLEELDWNYEVFTASTLAKSLEILRSEKIDYLITDAHFPDGNSLQIFGEITECNPEIKILVFSGIEEKTHGLKFINSGANGFISKLSDEEEVKSAIKQVWNSGKYLSPDLQNILIDSLRNPVKNPLEKLTEREMEIAELYGKGLGNLEISNLLHIKQNTVSTIKKRIFEKLGIENVLELSEILKDKI